MAIEDVTILREKALQILRMPSPAEVAGPYACISPSQNASWNDTSSKMTPDRVRTRQCGRRRENRRESNRLAELVTLNQLRPRDLEYDLLPRRAVATNFSALWLENDVSMTYESTQGSAAVEPGLVPRVRPTSSSLTASPSSLVSASRSQGWPIPGRIRRLLRSLDPGFLGRLEAGLLGQLQAAPLRNGSELARLAETIFPEHGSGLTDVTFAVRLDALGQFCRFVVHCICTFHGLLSKSRATTTDGPASSQPMTSSSLSAARVPVVKDVFVLAKHMSVVPAPAILKALYPGTVVQMGILDGPLDGPLDGVLDGVLYGPMAKSL